MLHFHMRK